MGRNDKGQLGDGTTESHSKPIVVPLDFKVKDIAAGAGFSVALSVDGSVYTWGENIEGQLGRGISSKYAAKAGRIKNLYKIEKVFAGETTAAAIRYDKSVYMWGKTYMGGTSDGEKPVISNLVERIPDDDGYYVYEFPDRMNYYEYDYLIKEAKTGVLLDVTVCSCGEYQAAAIAGGKLYTWGLSPAFKTGFLSQLQHYCAVWCLDIQDIETVVSGIDKTVYTVDKNGMLYKVIYNNKIPVLNIKNYNLL